MPNLGTNHVQSAFLIRGSRNTRALAEPALPFSSSSRNSPHDWRERPVKPDKMEGPNRYVARTTQAFVAYLLQKSTTAHRPVTMLARTILTKSTAQGLQSFKRFNSTSAKYGIPKFLPDAEKEFGITVPKNYVPPQYRDPHVKYDDQQNRVNFGEEIHPYHDYMDMWSPDHFQPVKDHVAVRQLATFMGLIGLFAYSIYAFDIWPDRPNMPRSYPYEGLYKDLGGREGEQALMQARVDQGN